MTAAFVVGQRVRAVKSVYEPADDEHPSGYLCSAGDLLIVRSVRPQAKTWPYSVSHEHITDRSFAVAADEIEPEDRP